MSDRWKEHPLAREGNVALLPTLWVYQYYGKDVSPEADLMDGTIVDMDGLWKNNLREGMANPLIIRVGLRDKKFRLESGNHRIQLFRAHGIPEVPVTIEVTNTCGPDRADVMTDATHNFDLPDGAILSGLTEGYTNPMKVFQEFPVPPHGMYF